MEKIVVANMKMNMTASEIDEYLKVINKKISNENVVICPTNIYIPYFLKQNYSVGIQNVFFKNSGTFTGEVSPKQAKSLGIKYAIIGHSERRMYFDETDDFINKKVIEALDNKLKVILCIGESLEEKNLLKTDKILKKQLINGLKNVKVEDLENVIIAYEPIWSISDGVNPSLIPTNDIIEKTIFYIKSIVLSEFDVNDINVLYGGSVNDKNIKELDKICNISGYLVGGASLDPKKLLGVIKEVYK